VDNTTSKAEVNPSLTPNQKCDPLKKYKYKCVLEKYIKRAHNFVLFPKKVLKIYAHNYLYEFRLRKAN